MSEVWHEVVRQHFICEEAPKEYVPSPKEWVIEGGVLRRLDGLHWEASLPKPPPQD